MGQRKKGQVPRVHSVSIEYRMILSQPQYPWYLIENHLTYSQTHYLKINCIVGFNVFFFPMIHLMCTYIYNIYNIYRNDMHQLRFDNVF